MIFDKYELNIKEMVDVGRALLDRMTILNEERKNYTLEYERLEGLYDRINNQIKEHIIEIREFNDNLFISNEKGDKK